MKTLALLSLAAVPSLALNIPTQQQRLFPDGLSHSQYDRLSQPSARETCPQAPKVNIPTDGFHSSQTFLSDDAFRARQAKRLSRAVQVPTTVGDYMKDPYDEAFEPVVKFQSLLEEMYPLV
jgi:Gly-Xaa carboxypeptidase